MKLNQIEFQQNDQKLHIDIYFVLSFENSNGLFELLGMVIFARSFSQFDEFFYFKYVDKLSSKLTFFYQ